jgi:hypothetical protein
VQDRVSTGRGHIEHLPQYHRGVGQVHQGPGQKQLIAVAVGIDQGVGAECPTVDPEHRAGGIAQLALLA